MKRYAFPFGITLLVAVVAYFSGATQTLGAHPFWAGNTIILGTPIGLALGYISTRLRFGLAIATLSGLTIVSYLIARTGQTQFATSYGDDAFAGQMWFLGWHMVVVFAVAALFVSAFNLKSA